MTERNYLTRMHRVLGVEAGREFSLDTLYPAYLCKMDEEGVVRDNLGREVKSSILAIMINHPERIIRRPRLDGCQKHLLKLLAKLDLKWLTIDSQNLIIAWEDKPKRITTAWFGKEGDYDTVNRYAISASKCPTLATLVSWSDPEPLDIVQTLRGAGISVEVE